jgi:hypothetical protein
VHMIFEVGGAATNKTKFQSPNDFVVAISRNLLPFELLFSQDYM